MTARHGVRLRTLLRRAGRHGEAIPADQATPLQAPVAPAETVSLGEWDTAAAREEAAAIFGPAPHGIATEETLAAIQAEAQRQAVGRHMAAQDRQHDEDATSWHRPEHARRNRPYTDSGETRIELPAVYQPPVTASECFIRMEWMLYPPLRGDSRGQYASMLREVDELTGTRTRWENETAWPAARTAPLAPIRTDGLRPLLALPAGAAS